MTAAEDIQAILDLKELVNLGRPDEDNEEVTEDPKKELWNMRHQWPVFKNMIDSNHKYF